LFEMLLTGDDVVRVEQQFKEVQMCKIPNG